MAFKVWNQGLRDLYMRTESRHGRERAECKFGDIGANETSVCVVGVFVMDIPGGADKPKSANAYI